MFSKLVIATSIRYALMITTVWLEELDLVLDKLFH